LLPRFGNLIVILENEANKEKGKKKPILTEKTLNNGKTVICNEDEGTCLMCSG
jgi:hypothetical protein